MNIDDMVRNMMDKHKNELQLFQLAVLSGIGSLVYSEYIRRIEQKTRPVVITMIPELRVVTEILHPASTLMRSLSDHLIDNMIRHKLMLKYMNAPELVLFKNENIEVLKTIFDVNIIYFIMEIVREKIYRKFRPTGHLAPSIRENRDIELFYGKPLNENHMDYILEQTVLHLLVSLQSMKKSVMASNRDNCFVMASEDILVVDNDQAITPICFNHHIFHNRTVFELLSFVTSTDIREMRNEELRYLVSTSKSNKVKLVTLNGIEVN